MRRASSARYRNVFGRGFTIIEVCLVIIVIGILSTIAFGATQDYQIHARDSERGSDTALITQDLERYYRTQAVATGATYPDTTNDDDDLQEIIGDTEATIAPDQKENSIVIATNNGTQAPSPDQYIYQPLNLNGSLCTSAPCVRFKLYYKLEETSTTVTLDSMRQQ